VHDINYLIWRLLNKCVLTILADADVLSVLEVESVNTTPNHCARHLGVCDIRVTALAVFPFFFLDQPVARHFCIKERHVLDFIRETLPDLPWVMNKTVQGGCSRRRPDITLDRGTFRLIVEVDENQHRGYSCENRRLMELFQDGGNVPLVLIRLNPDAYTSSEGTRVPSCFSVSESGSLTVPSRHKKQWEHRLLVLLSYLNTILSTTTCEREITIEELFYDGSPRPSAD
jgi:hypothetical protein